MKNSCTVNSVRVLYGSSLLIILVFVAGMGAFRASASGGASENQTKDKPVSVRLESQNSPLINLLPGRDLATTYGSDDYSSEQLKAEGNRPLALASADFDADGFPDLVTGYSSEYGGILTFHKGNPEAFAPQSEESFALIREGHFPDPFFEKAESFNIPAAPDFLVSGDFDRDGNTDVISATRGGDKIYLLSGTGRDGGFNAAREIDLSGRVTALTAGEIDAADNRADLAIGVEGDAGASLLVFEDAENGVLASSPSIYQISSPAISLELGKLDDDLFADTAILNTDGVSVLHGRNQRGGEESAKSGAARMEKINLPFLPQTLAIGNFIWNRAGKTQLALLTEDGGVRIARRGELDERPFSIEESRANRRQSAEKRLRGEVKENLKTWQSVTSEDWTIADGGVNVAASAVQQNNAAPILMKANLSGQNTDDILFLDAATREIKILSTQEPEKMNGEAVSFAGERSVFSLETANQPTAMLSMKLNVFARPGLMLLQSGKTEPSFVPASPTATFVVTKPTDTSDGACNADCSLREAITAANAAAGADIITLPAGTYTLTIANGGANEDNNATGDLDITQDLTITGAGQATTIVQAGTTNANGIDKVFASNPICTTVVNTSLSGLTIRYGRNTQPTNSADFSFTGGGLDWCNVNSGGTLTITSSTFDNNSAVNGQGGGIDLDTASTTGGTVTLTGVTISNNKSSIPANFTSYNGGGLAAIGGVYNLNITNSTFTNNIAQTGEGGGLLIAHSENSSDNSVSQLNNVTFTNNSAASLGGGIRFAGTGTESFTLQNSSVSGNTSGTAATRVAAGGGLYLSSIGTSTAATVTQSTITNNVLSANTADNRGGAGIFAGQGNITVSFNRIVGNTGTTAALGTGLRKDTNLGATNAVNNWWGCNTGPSAASCDTATLASGGTGSLNFNPWLRFTHTASPSSIVVGQNSTLTVSFLSNSNNQPIAAANLTALVGVPVTFSNALRGTISGAQAVIQSTGTATATFTGTSAGAGSANAAVDSGTATANITIAQASTTTTLTTSLTPTVFGQSVTFTATVGVTAPGAGSPTGTVTFRDNGVNIGTCAAQAVAANAATCTISSLSVGSHPIIAIYNGDANFTASATSNTVTQVVGKADTTATITNDTPDPSIVGQAYAVTASVAVNSPGAGTPTGTITVSDGSQTCTITLPATSCNLTSTTAGNKTLTATYNGDANFNQSPASAGVMHTVNTPPDLTITKTHTNNFRQGQIGAQYTITVTNSGGSSTSATVTVTDALPNGMTATAFSGTGWTCAALPSLTCTRNDALAAGSSYPIITLTVNVAINAASSITNSATVSGGGETNTANDTANDPTTVLAPTAATVEVGGRVTTTSGRGIMNVRLSLTDSQGNTRTTTSNSFGYYRFDVQAGATYILSASAKHYTFSQPTQVLNINNETDQVNFIANSEKRIRNF